MKQLKRAIFFFPSIYRGGALGTESWAVESFFSGKSSLVGGPHSCRWPNMLSHNVSIDWTQCTVRKKWLTWEGDEGWGARVSTLYTCMKFSANKKMTKNIFYPWLFVFTCLCLNGWCLVCELSSFHRTFLPYKNWNRSLERWCCS